MSAIVTVRNKCATEEQSARLYEHIRGLFAENPEITVQGYYTKNYCDEDPPDDP